MEARAKRRAKVEMALVRGGGEVNVSALARELGVSRGTVRRDVAAVRWRWVGLTLVPNAGIALEEDRARTAGMYELVAREALGQYERLAGETDRPGHSAAVGYLRVAMEALGRRGKLLGLERPGSLFEPEGPLTDREMAAYKRLEARLKGKEGPREVVIQIEAVEPPKRRAAGSGQEPAASHLR